MGKKIVVVGAGAVGGYAGGHMAAAGEDITFVDAWPANVEQLRTKGMRITHSMDVPELHVPKVRALHITELQQLSKERPVDIAFVCVKSYDTAWATMMIAQYLAPDGFVVSLQNCMNEEVVASVVGWGKTLGCVASSIMVNLPEPGLVHRGAGKGGDKHTVFRVGEVHGRATDRAREVCRLVGTADSAMVTANLWGERWSKLVTNCMGNGMSAATGLPGRSIIEHDQLRQFTNRLGAEAVRVGQALGYDYEEVMHVPTEVLAKAGEGDPAAKAECDAIRIRDSKRTAPTQRPSLAQDMQKGRRTEIEFLNGYIVREGARFGLPCRANAALTEIVKKVERGELRPDPAHILDLRLN